jgi:hypothetical protein
MHTHLLSPSDAHKYIIGGHGKFTLVGQTTRYTYRVGQTKDDDGNLSPLFISVLTGPDNSNDFQYLGYISLADLLTLRSGKKGNPNHPAFVALAWWLRVYGKGNLAALAKAEFWHEGTCCRCGRELTVPDSIAKGIGPVCEGRVAA